MTQPETTTQGHTLGPWSQNPGRGWEIVSETGDIAEVCGRAGPNLTNYYDDPERQANSALIAAAPETADERDRLLAINAELLTVAHLAANLIHVIEGLQDSKVESEPLTEIKSIIVSAIAHAEAQP